MTQPAKLQEPSMEEILASIRRIIADDEAKPSEVKPAADAKPAEAKPAAAEKPQAPPAKPAAPPPAAKAPAMNDIPPSKIPAAQAAVAKAAPPAPAPAASNSQDDIDAMLAGLDEATSEAEIRPAAPEVEEVFDLTDEMAVAPPEPPQPSFHKVEPADDLEFTEAAAARTMHRTPAFESSPFETPAAPPQQQILSHSTVSAVESAFNSLAHTVLSNNARTLEDLVKEMLRPMLKSWLDDNLPGLVERIVKAEIERVSRGR
jgi:cell pole-organizing protein PopZ